MAQPQKGRLIQGLYKPIHGNCAIYFYPGVYSSYVYFLFIEHIIWVGTDHMWKLLWSWMKMRVGFATFSMMVGTDDGVLGMKIVMVLKCTHFLQTFKMIRRRKTLRWFTKMRVVGCHYPWNAQSTTTLPHDPSRIIPRIRIGGLVKGGTDRILRGLIDHLHVLVGWSSQYATLPPSMPVFLPGVFRPQSPPEKSPFLSRRCDVDGNQKSQGQPLGRDIPSNPVNNGRSTYHIQLVSEWIPDFWLPSSTVRLQNAWIFYCHVSFLGV